MLSFISTRIACCLLLLAAFQACRQGAKQADADANRADTASIAKGHPAWSLQSNIYEVNLRQYGQSSSFAGFQNELQRLKDMGVHILWFMPITPISVKDRKGTLGSYYAVQNYRQVNPEYGTMDQWKALVSKAHDLGMKVITDWVPNHSGADHPWLQSHPDFYERDSAGNFLSPFDWTDVRKLNYANAALRDSMIASMKFWVTETGIDGFRCDVAGEVPVDFWKQCIDSLRAVKHVFMLAEADKPELHNIGFDASYAWSVQNVLYGIYSGKTNLARLQAVIDSVESLLPADAMRMYFTVNHDENSWNGTEYERFGDAAKTFAVWTMTMHRSIPLVYSGQEEPNKKRLQFFEKDPIQFGKYELAPFYKTLLELRKDFAALATDASFKKLQTGKDDAVYAFVRRKGMPKVVVLLNFSNKKQEFSIDDDEVNGEMADVFTGQATRFAKPQSFSLGPWEYKVYRN
ncbi:MAG TPA: alpha-amylase family glycosyl hydrolase [Chitinophagaceae bacterium]|nr:alpha-amylase family glycosyl hydrolase [Chitinophagaceae bacterium]